MYIFFYKLISIFYTGGRGKRDQSARRIAQETPLVFIQLPISRKMRNMVTASPLQWLEKWLPSKRIRVRLVGFGSAIPGSSNPVDTVWLEKNNYQTIVSFYCKKGFCSDLLQQFRMWFLHKNCLKNLGGFKIWPLDGKLIAKIPMPPEKIYRV